MIKSGRCLLTSVFIGTRLIDSSSSTPIDLTVNTNVESASGYWADYPVPSKEETKKRRIQKTALEKMYASWNNKKYNVIKIKQVCKPRHAINYFGGKKFKTK